MNETANTIRKNPQLPPAEDYERLRAAGFAAVEELASARWTDYNAHDPGITILEALTYALTELGYRTGFDIADLLTEESGYISFRQALFTARRILTNNALTVNDLRKVLIDLPRVRNGWLLCKECACETTLYAECGESQLYHAPLWRLQPPKPTYNRLPSGQHEHPVVPRGLYDVLLQLEIDSELGDLNNRKVQQTLSYALTGGATLAPLTMELRFPDWEAENPDLYRQFVSTDGSFTFEPIPPETKAIRITRFSRDRTLSEPVDEASFVQGWRNLFFADYEIDFVPESGADPETLRLTAVPIRFFSSSESVKRAVVVSDLIAILETSQNGGLIDRYRRKLLAVRVSVAEARQQLHAVRNLAEDYCRIQGILTEDVAVCADVEVSAEADLEYVLARIYHEIELHFNPQVPFYSLQELAAEGLPTEAIFEGPALENGFIKDEDLEAAQLRAVVHVSDLYNRLMDIPGIVTIQNMIFTRYDDLGNPILPPHTWTIPIRPLHIPKLYLEASRFLFYKNGLPFLPRGEEVRAILAQLRGEQEHPKLPLSARDYPIPVGIFRRLAEYVPVQHTFPLTYGIGPAGLSPQVTALRRAQAHQMKGYLLPFEQLLADMTEQLAHAGDLFSTDETVDRTYATHFFDPAAAAPEIAGLAELLTTEATEDNLRLLAEPLPDYYDRRNRFLDHLLARFGEQFRDYALMLYANADRIAFAPDKLIRDKIRFLRFYPRISADRGRAFNYRDADRPCDPRNRAGLADRISRLLGMDTLTSYFTVGITNNQGVFRATFTLIRPEPAPATLLLLQDEPLEANSGEAAEYAAWLRIGDIIANSVEGSKYTTDGEGNDILTDETSQTLARLDAGITPTEVTDFTTSILAQERLYLIEHLLLRPKFPGDAVLPVCLAPDCRHCGEEDPYSFRLTYVLQGALEPFSYDIDLRRFADQTIRRETSAHLLPKICWVGNAGFAKDECAPVFDRLITLLQEYLGLDGAEAATCECANAVYDAFDALFQPWIEPLALELYSRGQWERQLRTLFADVALENIPCLEGISAAGWDAIRAQILLHFTDLVVAGRQFDRLEAAWCAWLAANVPFEWQAENELLRGRVEALLLQHLGERTTTANACACAGWLLGYFGNQFRDWIGRLVDNNDDPADLEVLLPRLASEVWIAFREDLRLIFRYDPNFCQLQALTEGSRFWTELLDLLQTSYADWIEVSYRLHVLIRVFSDLQSVYPTATLHDCDDGSDDNPVRLNNTILGTL